jgi:hypothetical protein
MYYQISNTTTLIMYYQKGWQSECPFLKRFFYQTSSRQQTLYQRKTKVQCWYSIQYSVEVYFRISTAISTYAQMNRQYIEAQSLPKPVPTTTTTQHHTSFCTRIKTVQESIVSDNAVIRLP